MRKIKNKKVIVAMSGGVDSSVAAALLKRAGFKVLGVFMKFWSPHYSEAESRVANPKNGLVGTWNRCCSPEAEKRARRVAKILTIPFYVFNFEKEFKKRIVDYFLTEYGAGRTPNPCVVCNKEIKFGLLLEKALGLGVHSVATGHYVRLNQENQNSKSETRKLLRGKDREKDQSYFLWQLNQNQLKHILFPIGDYTKARVRALARKFRLPISDIPESQEICFIQTTINDFLSRYLQQRPGKIILVRSGRTEAGEMIGQHQGLAFYTIGQRKGMGLTDGPFYVLDKDLKKNALVVTKNKKDLLRKELIAKNVNWISGRIPKLPLKIKAKIRSQHQPASATIIQGPITNICQLTFVQPQLAITPGQSVVFYRGQEVLGGGIIC